MANKDPKNVKRFIENISKDVANAAYNGEGGGTTVVANPTLVGDEDDLTGLEVNGVKYAVPQGSGSGVYSICVYFYDANSPDYTNLFTMQVDTPDLETYDDLTNYLLNKGYGLNDGNALYYPIVGINNDEMGTFVGIHAESADPNSLQVLKYDGGYKYVGRTDFSLTYLGQNQGE